MARRIASSNAPVQSRRHGPGKAPVRLNVNGESHEVAAVHDFGRVINPLTLSSQVEGGIVQGTGYALMEERIMDPQTGRPLNPNLEAYKIPTMLDVPLVEYAFVDRPDVICNSIGARGAGEPPIIPTAPAIANAVFDATGVRIRSLPITRDRIWSFAQASAAIQVSLADARVADVRIVLGGVAAVPWRARAAEDVLRGNTPTAKLVESASDAAVRGARPLGSNGYKVKLARALVKRGLSTLLGLQ
mgnify:CR=1 FL=1